jgi:hypothetical protein
MPGQGIFPEAVGSRRAFGNIEYDQALIASGSKREAATEATIEKRVKYQYSERDARPWKSKNFLRQVWTES